MKKTVILLLAMFILMTGTGLFAADQDKYDEWLKKAQLGPYQPEVEDWDAIYKAALDEPVMSIYSATSRIHPSIKEMLKKYPGLKIEPINLGGIECNERVLREWEAGIRQVGILHSGAPDFHYSVLMPRKALTNYVPRELQKIMDPVETTPMLRHRYYAAVWIYTTKGGTQKSPPWKNIWEFTTEKWRGRVAIWDALETDLSREFFAALMTNSKLMEDLYRENFGRPIQLTTPNAGLEFMKRLLENDARLFPDHRDVDQAVSDSDGLFAGLTTSSAYRLAHDGTYDFDIDTTAPSYRGYNTLLIYSFTPSPNTAKLVVKWLMSEEGGKKWWGPNFPPESLNYSVPKPWLTMKDFNRMLALPIGDLKKSTDIVVDYWLLWR